MHTIVNSMCTIIIPRVRAATLDTMEQTTPTLEDLIAGIAEMLGSVRAEIDRESRDSPETSTQQAKQLLEVLRDEAAEASALYSLVIYRLREDRKLSLSQLAEKLNVSKARMANIVNQGKALEDGEAPRP